METLAQRLPTAVLTYLMGMPEQDAERVRAWSAVLNALIPGPISDTDAWKHLEGYILGLLAGYRMAEQAPDTIIARLLKTDLTQEEIFMTIFQLLVAGADTTTMLLGSLLWELLRVSERWEAVQADRKLIMPVVEEALRLHPPLNWVMRSCPASVTMHGETLPAGSRIVAGIASANRDEARWGATAEDFEIRRPNVANHVTFGAGRHFCLGAQLARLQASVALEILLERVPTLRLARGYQYDPLAGAMIHGPRSLLVQWS